jgi:archaellum component FlaF (FlaF/FlaG flagellin family)
MVAKWNVRKGLHRLLVSRTGTAEIIGSVMFLLIMMFFFTNVFLWHDNASRQMDGVLSEKMNSPVSIQIFNMNASKEPQRAINVTNNGGADAYLSRLWIIDAQGHSFVNLEAGGGTRVLPGDTIYVDVPSYVPTDETVTFKIITTLGNTAACKYEYVP